MIILHQHRPDYYEVSEASKKEWMKYFSFSFFQYDTPEFDLRKWISAVLYTQPDITVAIQHPGHLEILLPLKKQWIEHLATDKDICPVEDGHTLIEVESVTHWTEYGKAGSFDWKHREMQTDILRYRFASNEERLVSRRQR